jgi:poly(beta-D-mannuronate) C5 epimerase
MNIKRYIIVFSCVALCSLGVLSVPYLEKYYDFKAQTAQDDPEHAQKKYDLTTSAAVNLFEKAPKLPNISGFTTQAVRAKLPAPSEGVVFLEYMASSRIFFEMTFSRFLPAFAKFQGTDYPQFINITNGNYTLDSLIATVNDPNLLEKTDLAYNIKMPIIVGAQASLQIVDADRPIHLWSDRGAFISNFGKFYLINSTLAGWIGTENKPAVFVEKKNFRPFFNGWGGSESYLADNKISHLGYSGTKSFGISYTSTSKIAETQPEVPPAKGWVINNTFEDLYFGFYSYEAEDIAIIGNNYINNIIYGIDPHDRSKRLIIAYNHITGTHKKHGIIISREVNDSWIFNNHSHHNHGSGIMLDRQCHNNIIAFNRLESNEGDGLTFYESPHNTTWHNIISKNAKSGIRIRNSNDLSLRFDTIVDHLQYGITGYVDDFTAEERDLSMDPYDKVLGVHVGGVELSNNKRGHINMYYMDDVTLQDLKIFRTGDQVFSGILSPFNTPLFEGSLKPDSAIMISQNLELKAKTEKAEAKRKAKEDKIKAKQAKKAQEKAEKQAAEDLALQQKLQESLKNKPQTPAPVKTPEETNAEDSADEASDLDTENTIAPKQAIQEQPTPPQEESEKIIDEE